MIGSIFKKDNVGDIILISSFFIILIFMYLDIGLGDYVKKKSVILNKPYIEQSEYKVIVDIDGRGHMVDCYKVYYDSVNVGDTITYFQKVGFFTGLSWRSNVSEGK